MVSKSVVKRLPAVQEVAERVLVYVAVGIIAIMIFLTSADVFMRYVFNRPIPSTFELEQFLLVGVVYLTLAYVQYQKGHIRLDILADRSPPRIQTALRLFSHVICLVTFAFITWRSGIEAYKAWSIGEYTMGLISYPLWPAKWMIPIGSALLCFRFISDIYSDVHSPANMSPSKANEGGMG